MDGGLLRFGHIHCCESYDCANANCIMLMLIAIALCIMIVINLLPCFVIKFKIGDCHLQFYDFFNMIYVFFPMLSGEYDFQYTLIVYIYIYDLPIGGGYTTTNFCRVLLLKKKILETKYLEELETQSLNKFCNHNCNFHNF